MLDGASEFGESGHQERELMCLLTRRMSIDAVEETAIV